MTKVPRSLRVAVVVPARPWPAATGEAVRSAALVEELRRQGHDVRLFGFAWSAEDLEADDGTYIPGRPLSGALRRAAWRAFLACRRRWAYFALFDSRRKARLSGLLREWAPDVVDFQHAYMYVPTGLPDVVTLHNVESARLQGEIGPIRLAHLRHREQVVCRRARQVVCFSGVDAELLRQHARPRDLHVVPIGVHTPPPAQRKLMQTRRLRRLCFVGTVDYSPNFEAAAHLYRLWPRLRSEAGVESLVIAGRRADLLPDPPAGITVLSDVPDIGEILLEADALIVPLTRGGGVRIKILEAFARGLPVITTEKGIEGIVAEPRRHALVGSSPDALVSLCREAQDAVVRRSLAAEAFSLHESTYSVTSMASEMARVYLLAIARGRD